MFMKKFISIAMILLLAFLTMGMGNYENAVTAIAATEVNVTAYGATADDSTDDTASIQEAINTGAATVIIPDGTYMIDAMISILPLSNQKIVMSQGTILKAIPNSGTVYAIIKVFRVSNVEITGGKLIGERYTHTVTDGQNGFGVWVASGTENVIIRNLTSIDSNGDGIYIGSATGVAKNVLVENVVCDNNRRQGMSITFADNVNVINSRFTNTNGTHPQNGIDIEPNKNCYVNNVTIKNCSFINNTRNGIGITGEYGLYVNDVKIFNCQFTNNLSDLLIGSKVTNSGYTASIGYTSYTGVTSASIPSSTYRTHVQDIGWQGNVSNGAISGTSGKSKRLEGICITVDNLDGGIEYMTHVQDIGWMDWTSDGDLSGTTGQSKRLEAIQIRLTGAAADTYDIYYRVHVQDTGWLDWAQNGQPAGTAGFSYRLEAIQIMLVTKGEAAPGSTATAFIQAPIPQAD